MSVRGSVTPQSTVAHQVPFPWSFPGKNTGVGCHFPLQEISRGDLERKLMHWQVDSLPQNHLKLNYFMRQQEMRSSESRSVMSGSL